MPQTAKPVSDATRALLEEMRYAAAPSPDKLDALRAEIAKLRDKEIEIAELEARLTELKLQVKEITEQTLVELFDQAGCNRIGIEAHGNLPAYDVGLIDFYHANIPEQHREAAFEYLTEIDQADLIKTEFKVAFGLKEAKETERFARLLEKAGIEYSAKKGVPWNTLTAWFKREYQRKPLTARAMEILGASIARMAKVIKQREKK